MKLLSLLTISLMTVLTGCATSAPQATASRGPSSIPSIDYRTAEPGTDYVIEKISPAEETRAEREKNKFTYAEWLSRARMLLKQQSYDAAASAKADVDGVCSASNTGVSLPAGANWQIKHFEAGIPSCDGSGDSIRCETPYTATCSLQ